MDRREAFKMLGAGFAALSGTRIDFFDNDIIIDDEIHETEKVISSVSGYSRELGFGSGVFDSGMTYNYDGLTSIGVILVNDYRQSLNMTSRSLREVDNFCEFWPIQFATPYKIFKPSTISKPSTITRLTEPASFTWEKVNSKNPSPLKCLTVANDELWTLLTWHGFGYHIYPNGGDVTVDFGDTGFMTQEF